MTLIDALKWVGDKLDDGFWLIIGAVLTALYKIWRKFSTDSKRIDMLEQQNRRIFEELQSRSDQRREDREAVKEVGARVERMDSKIDDLKDILLRREH